MKVRQVGGYMDNPTSSTKRYKPKILLLVRGILSKTSYTYSK